MDFFRWKTGPPKLNPYHKRRIMGPLPWNAYIKGDSDVSHVHQCYIMGVLQYAHLQTVRKSQTPYCIQTRIGSQSLRSHWRDFRYISDSGLCCNVFRIRFLTFFDVSAQDCARISTGDVQSVICGYSVSRRYVHAMKKLRLLHHKNGGGDSNPNFLHIVEVECLNKTAFQK